MPDRLHRRASPLVAVLRSFRSGTGRRVRVLAGVDEKLLSWVPSERPRYTALGGVVLGTATIAAFSMFLALNSVLDGASPLLLFPVLGWGLFVLNLDRWLVSSSTGSRWARRTPLLLPRLLLAVFFGIVIAEPLVLRVFETAIEQHILDQRAQDVRDLESRLYSCNPTPGSQTTASTDCVGARLDLGVTSAGPASELAGLRREAGELQTSVEADEKSMRGLDDLAVDECIGRAGPGRTGVPGVGTECQTRRANAADYRRTHDTGARRARLQAVQARILVLERQVGTSTTTFEQQRKVAVDGKVRELREHQGPIGLLERFKALDELVAGNSFLHAALWAIRGFFIVVDSLPVLVKLFSGTTSYDRLVERQQESAERVQSEAALVSERSVIANLQSQLHAAQSTARRANSKVDLDERRFVADVEGSLDDAIDSLERDLLRQARHQGTGRRNGAAARL